MSQQPFNPADDQPLDAPPADGHPVPGSSFMRDTTVPLDVATFDLAGWVRGVRPTRRTVKLYLASHLVGEMDELADRIDSAADGVDTSADVAEFERLRQEYLGSVTYWTVEARSSEWVQKAWEERAKANRIRLTNGDTKVEKERMILILDQLSQQIVQVKSLDGQVVAGGVSEAVLRDLFQRNEREFNKLLYAMSDANNAPADRAGVITRDFSQRSSTARSGAAS